MLDVEFWTTKRLLGLWILVAADEHHIIRLHTAIAMLRLFHIDWEKVRRTERDADVRCISYSEKS